MLANIDDGSCDYSCHDVGDFSLQFDGMDDYVNLGRPVSTYDGDIATFSLWFSTSHDYSDGSIWNNEDGVLITNDTQADNPEFALLIQVDNSLVFVRKISIALSASILAFFVMGFFSRWSSTTRNFDCRCR